MSQDRDILQDFPKAQTPAEIAETQDLVKDFKRFREAPVDSVKTLIKHVTGSSWRSYDDYIGPQLYTPGLTEYFKQQTLLNPALREKINQLAQTQLNLELPLPDLNTIHTKSEQHAYNRLIKTRTARYAQLQQWLYDMSNRMVDEMSVSFDHKSVLKFMAYVVAQIFSRTYHQGVHVNLVQIESLRQKAAELKQKKQSIIFLPCHKSHIDYMSIQFVCFRLGISLPAVVAGDNLNFAVIGPMLRQVGAFYIRRSFGNDKLYNATMQAYVEMLLSNGFNFECFIEGTRSRSGKLLPPKFGMLKFLVEAILSGRVEDSWVVPVSTQYDKVAEAETYATELLGKEKKKETFLDFLSARKIMALQMGRVDVRFHQGWSLREFVTLHVSRELTRMSLDARLPNFDTLSSTELAKIAQDPSILTPEIKIRLLRSLGYRVLADMNSVSVVMPTSLIGTMLLTNRGRGMSKDNLERRVRWLIAQIKRHGGKIGEFHVSSISDVVENALQVLGPELVGEETKGLLQNVYYAKDPFKLSYYRNQVIHLFVPEAIVAVAMYSRILNMPNSENFITYSDLLGRVTFLSRLLSGEFVFGPEGIQTNLVHTLQQLEEQEVVVVEKQNEEDIIRISPKEVALGKENFDFYCFFVWPFVDGFWLTLVSLFSLTPTRSQVINYFKENKGYQEYEAIKTAQNTSSLDKTDVPLLWIDEKLFLSNAQALGKTLYHQGIITYYEAVNKEMLKNSLLQYVAEGIVLQRKAERRPTMYALHPAWLPSRYYEEKIDSTLLQNPLPTASASKYVPDGSDNYSLSDLPDSSSSHPINFVLDGDPTTKTHMLHEGDIIPSGKLYDFEESVALTRRFLRLRKDSSSLTVPVLRLVSSLVDGSRSSTEDDPFSLFTLGKARNEDSRFVRREKKGTKPPAYSFSSPPINTSSTLALDYNAQARKFISNLVAPQNEQLVIQSLNEASQPETDNTAVTVSRPSKVAYSAKL